MTGCVSDIDRKLAETGNFQPLNRFDRWLCDPFIRMEKSHRSEVFRQACIEVTSEDPYRQPTEEEER